MKLLIVDDIKENLLIINSLLKKEITGEIYLANGYSEMKNLISQHEFDLIMLDIMMPEKDGLDILQELKSEEKYRKIPVIMLTAIEEMDLKQKAFELGAIDYVTKPFNPRELFLRVKNQLELLELRIELEKYNHYLQDLVSLKVKEILNTRNVTIFALAKLAESRDKETGEHLMRIMEYVKRLAIELSYKTNKYKIDDEYIKNITISSVLHDIGKVGIPDAILLKPGKLDTEEFEIIKKHTIIGGETLENAEKQLEYSDFLEIGKFIAYHHHEKWDGTGYPNGLKGESIPLSARIVTIADIFDALMSKRVYKEAFSFEETLQIMVEQKGKTFDPEIFDVFFSIRDKFLEIFKKF